MTTSPRAQGGQTIIGKPFIVLGAGTIADVLAVYSAAVMPQGGVPYQRPLTRRQRLMKWLKNLWR